MKIRSKLTCMMIIATLFVFPVTSALAYMPAIIEIVMDGSGSIKPGDFEIAKKGINEFALLLNERGHLYSNQGQFSDWLSVAFFGGDDDYDETIFVNCYDNNKMLELMAYVYSKNHPKYGHTSIYTATGRGLRHVFQHEKWLVQNGVPPNSYAQILIVITDGKDTSKNSELKRLVRNSFPNEFASLFMVGVGPDCDLREFKGIADLVLMIDNFDKLAAILFYILEYM